MDGKNKSLLLMFVTSCPRTPTFGCQDISPPFTIIRVDHGEEHENTIKNRLPTASTCSNVLHLPDY
jgi:hypothetical protein